MIHKCGEIYHCLLVWPKAGTECLKWESLQISWLSRNLTWWVSQNCHQTSRASQTFLPAMGHFHPSCKGKTETEKRVNQRKKERKERTQGSKFALEAGCFLCLSWAVFNAVRPVAWCETRYYAPFVQDSGLGWEVLSLAIHQTRPSPPPEKCLATINIVAVMAPGVMRQRGLPQGYWGGLVWYPTTIEDVHHLWVNPASTHQRRWLSEWQLWHSHRPVCLNMANENFGHSQHTHTILQISNSPLFIQTHFQKSFFCYNSPHVSIIITQVNFCVNLVRKFPFTKYFTFTF